MNKFFPILLIIFVILLGVRPAEAGHGHGGAFLFGLGLGFLLSPPVVYAAPPVYYAPPYPTYPPGGYYRYYYGGGPVVPSRAWVRGHWERRWDPYSRCWRDTWIPGFWRHY